MSESFRDSRRTIPRPLTRDELLAPNLYTKASIQLALAYPYIFRSRCQYYTAAKLRRHPHFPCPSGTFRGCSPPFGHDVPQIYSLRLRVRIVPSACRNKHAKFQSTSRNSEKFWDHVLRFNGRLKAFLKMFWYPPVLYKLSQNLFH